MRGAVRAGRRAAETLMIEMCTIRRPGDPVFDPETGEYDETSTVIYSGRCRVKPGGGYEVEPGGTEMILHRWTVSVPMTAEGILPDDMVEITASELDGDLVGKELAVVEVPAGSQLTARRLVCEVPR